ncbi:molybdopterin-dependent oxidoreductase [Acaricomes phytoseiuli]|uniref:molybdopterin-dependent oxidoreductase n=1 Tax=Acaricomes phytoseiuli TaxID=291968 RepID=UPI00036F0CE1|nr:molybdopterin-dependent oxidoreductase [Acaricomes phytoseiuli]
MSKHRRSSAFGNDQLGEENRTESTVQPAGSGARKLRRAGLSGLLAALAGLGLSELISALLPGGVSPMLAVGAFIIDIVPSFLKDLAISLFGTQDKLVLLISIGAGIAVFAAVSGIAERFRPPLGSVFITVFGIAGVLAAITRANASWSAALPALAGGAFSVLVLRFLISALQKPSTQAPASATEGTERAGLIARRSFGQLAIGAAAIGVIGIAVGRAISQAATTAYRFVIPQAQNPEALPEGTDLNIDGLSPFVTPNGDFYRIDTALTVPQIDPQQWSLRIFGMVDQEVTVSFEELLTMPVLERSVTLTCVSNEVGGELAGNAIWTGVPIRDLLSKAGVSDDADMVLSMSQDGYTAGTPLDALTDPNRDAILAMAMNGEPLPPEHGYPVRMVVPGLYGYVSATKWVVSMEVTRFDQKQAYWTPRGYAEKAPIKLASRIEVPKSFASLTPGPVVVAGTAWAQHTGVDAVEVRFDKGPWQRATLGAVPSNDTWRQWRGSAPGLVDI